MKISLRPSAARGHANHGWLDSFHTFSFANYYDPAHMGFRSLRVINQDVIAPGAGFPTHPHHDMEIFSYILYGALEHQDSMGNGRVLLQIWIQPAERGLPPSYAEWHPDPAQEHEAKVLVISADGREGSATIHQDASIYRIRLAAGQSVSHETIRGRGLWFQLINGHITAHGHHLSPGDALSTEDEGTLTLTAEESAEGLLFDLK